MNPRAIFDRIFAIGHRQKRPVVVHSDHFCSAPSLRLVGCHRVTLLYPIVIDPQFQTRLEADFVPLNCCNHLPGTILVGLAVRLEASALQ